MYLPSGEMATYLALPLSETLLTETFWKRNRPCAQEENEDAIGGGEQDGIQSHDANAQFVLARGVPTFITVSPLLLLNRERTRVDVTVGSCFLEGWA
jgi:hypothetical protein